MAKRCPKCKSDNPGTATFCADCGTQLPSVDAIEVTETMEAPKEELTTGSTFAGRYQIIEELGKGGMGKVYKVHDTKIKEKIALKLIKPEIVKDKKTIERFSNELKFARKIRHKNICQMFDLSEDRGTHYITMEFVDGQDLKRLIRQSGQLAIGTTLSIAKQVCDGLAEAHTSGVVHRDLKPSNIMIDAYGNARIMDFGIARSIGGKGITGAGVMIGTPEYMSPEQVEGKEVEQRSDIYSLGVILYEMTTGRLPFEGDTPLAVAIKHKGETAKNPREFNPQIPDELSGVILKCLEKDKENRYQNADELKIDLAKLEQGQPTTVKSGIKTKPITSREITVQFNLKKILIPSLTIVVVIAVALFFLLRTGTKTYSNHVVVAEFINQTGDPNLERLGRQAAQQVSLDLESLGLFGVAPITRFEMEPRTSPEEADFLEIAKNSDSAIVASGELYYQGTNLEIRSKIYDARKKKIIPSPGTVSGPMDNISGVLAELGDRMKSAVLSTQDPKVEMWQRVSTYIPKYEALQEFIRGIALFVVEDYMPSREYFLRAVEIDPQYVLALEFVTVCFLNTDLNEADKYIDKLKQFSNFSPGERLHFDFITAAREGQWENMYSNWKQLEALAPGTTLSVYLAWVAICTNRPRTAIEALDRLNRDNVYVYCNYCYWDLLTKARHMLGQYKQELKDALEAQKQHPEIWQSLYYKIRALSALGRVDDVSEVIKESYAKPITDNWYPAKIMIRAAEELRSHGNPIAAAEMCEQAISWLIQREQKEGLTKNMKFILAWALSDTQNWDEARAYFRNLIEFNPEEIDYLGSLGVLAARQGENEEALLIFDRLKNWDKPNSYGDLAYWQAAIAAHLGDKDNAVSLLLTAFQQGLGGGYQSFYSFTDLEPLWDFPAFIEMMKPRD